MDSWRQITRDLFGDIPVFHPFDRRHGFLLLPRVDPVFCVSGLFSDPTSMLARTGRERMAVKSFYQSEFIYKRKRNKRRR